jgi:hypothetical protein
MTRAQSPNEQPGHTSALLTNRPLLPESRFAKSRLIKGHSACAILEFCARLRATLSNYASAEETGASVAIP